MVLTAQAPSFHSRRFWDILPAWTTGFTLKMLDPLTGQNVNLIGDPNDEAIDERNSVRLAVSDFLMAVWKGCFVVFLGYLIVDSLPLELLIPNWQLRFISRLLSLGFIPLLGFACLHLAALLNPANHFYRQRLVMIRQWAVVAAIGFLLLIPLQGYSTWRAYTDAKVTQQTQIQQAKKRAIPLKQAIQTATTTTDLLQKLSRLQGVRTQLTPEDLSRPLEMIKKEMIANLERSENLYADRLSTTTDPNRIWSAIQAGTRTFVVSIGYFIAFAAGAQPKNSSYTLLDMLARRFNSLSGRGRRRLKR